MSTLKHNVLADTQTGKVSRKVYSITLLQILAMLLIVLSHSNPDGIEIPHWMRVIVPYLQGAGLATFMWSSGFLASKTDALKNGYFTFLFKRVKRLIVPYIACSLLLYIPKNILFLLLNREQTSNIFYALLTPRNGILPHLWFLPTLFLISCLYPIWEKLLRNKVGRIIVILICICMQFAPTITSVFCVDDILKFSLYYVIGIYIGMIPHTGFEKKTIAFIAVIICILGITSVFAHFQKLTMLIYNLGMLILLLVVSVTYQCQMKCICDYIGKYTYPIYIMSLPLQNLICILLIHIGLSAFPIWVILFLSGVFLPFLVAKCMEWLCGKMRMKFLLRVIGL